MEASLFNDSSEASTGAVFMFTFSEASIGVGLASIFGDTNSVDSAGFEREWGAAATGAFAAIGVGLALGLGVIK